MRRSTRLSAQKKPSIDLTRPSTLTSNVGETLNEIGDADTVAEDHEIITTTATATIDLESDIDDDNDDRLWSENQLSGKIDRDALAAKVLAIRSSTEFIAETKCITGAVAGNPAVDCNSKGVTLKNALQKMYAAVKDKYDRRVKGELCSLWAKDHQQLQIVKGESEKDTSSSRHGIWPKLPESEEDASTSNGHGIWPKLPESEEDASTSNGHGIWPKLPEPKEDANYSSRHGIWPKLPEIKPTGGIAKTIITDSPASSEEKVVLTTPIIKIQAVEAMPPYDWWDELSFNMKAQDSKYLTNIPYIPTLHKATGRKEKKFMNQLLETFKYKVHGERITIDLDDISYLELIVLMMTALERKNRNSAVSHSPGSEKPGNLNLYPTYSVFRVLAKELELSDSPQQLAFRYIRDCKKMFPIMETKATEFNMVCANFCERCLVFCCIVHDDDDKMPGRRDYMEDSDAELEDLQPCKNEDCIRRCPPTKESVQAEGTTEVWTESEERLFHCLIKGMKGVHCAVAQYMTTKSCRQVYEHNQLTKVVVAENIETESSQMSQKKKNGTTGKQTLWLRNYKKNFEGAAEEAGSKIRYLPCYHPGYQCDDVLHCQCYFSKTGCDKYCGCSKECPSRFPGCVCKGKCTTNSCPCHSVGRECDPALCKSCQLGNNEERSCRNDSMIRKLPGKKLVIRKSAISGFGAFISEDAEGGGIAMKGEFIVEYTGELISQDEAERRGCIYDEKRHTFLFNLNDHFVIDASYVGSRARFINSSTEANCDAIPILVDGDHRVGIFAKTDIKKGEELTFNYTTVLRQYGMVKTPKRKKANGKIGVKTKKTGHINKK